MSARLGCLVALGLVLSLVPAAQARADRCCVDASLQATYAGGTVSATWRTPGLDLCPMQLIVGASKRADGTVVADEQTGVGGCDATSAKLGGLDYDRSFFAQIEFQCPLSSKAFPDCANARAGEFVLSAPVEVAVRGGPPPPAAAGGGMKIAVSEPRHEDQVSSDQPWNVATTVTWTVAARSTCIPDFRYAKLYYHGRKSGLERALPRSFSAIAAPAYSIWQTTNPGRHEVQPFAGEAAQAIPGIANAVRPGAGLFYAAAAACQATDNLNPGWVVRSEVKAVCHNVSRAPGYEAATLRLRNAIKKLFKAVTGGRRGCFALRQVQRAGAREVFRFSYSFLDDRGDQFTGDRAKLRAAAARIVELCPLRRDGELQQRTLGVPCP